METAGDLAGKCSRLSLGSMVRQMDCSIDRVGISGGPRDSGYGGVDSQQAGEVLLNRDTRRPASTYTAADAKRAWGVSRQMCEW